MSREKIRETIPIDYYSCTSAWEFKKRIDDAFNSIPEEFQDDAGFDVEATEYYGSYETSMEMYYYRPETDEEMRERQKKLRSKKAVEEEREKELLKQLQKKYGGK